MKILQITSSEKPAFIYINALDESLVDYSVNLFNSSKRILPKSPGNRISTIRPHTQDEIGEPFQKLYTGHPREVKYPWCSLDENITPDAMGSRLEAEILKKIPKGASEM